ncbi:MAG: hypothetical protein WDM76_18330 [Limisphaerales bacterium]
MIGEEMTFVVAASAGVKDGVGGSAFRCHNHTANPAKARMLTATINDPFEVFLCGGMASVSAGLIDNKPQTFCKAH